MSYETITRTEFENRLKHWSQGRTPNKSRLVTRLSVKVRESAKKIARGAVDGIDVVALLRSEASDEVLKDEFISRFVKDSSITNSIQFIND